MKQKYIKYSTWIVCVLISICLGYFMFITAQCNADESYTYVYLYNYFELGNMKLDWSTFLNPWFFSSAICYLLNIGGTGSTVSIAYLAIWFGIATFLTLIISMYDTKNKWLLLLAFFILLPYDSTNRYHMLSIIPTLFLLLSVQYYNDKKKKWIFIVDAIVAIYTLLFSNDKLLFVLNVGATMVIFSVIYLWQNKRKYLYIAFLALSFIAMVLCLLGLTGEIGGYGGSEYVNWIDVHTLFDKGIPSFFAALFVQWNIPFGGGMLQPASIYWMVRIILAMLSLVALVNRMIQIIKKGIVNVNIVDSLSVICVIAVASVNIFNKMVWYYELENAPINRYAGVCWLLLVIILIRWVDEKWTDEVLCRKITLNLVVIVCTSMLIIGYGYLNYVLNDTNIDEYCKNEINFLRENGDTYQYGIASLWKSYPITSATNSVYTVYAAEIKDSKIYDQGYGTDCYNFIISDYQNEMSVEPSVVEELRDDYIGTYSNTSLMYLYDYDIRWEPKIIMECIDDDYELTDGLQYHLEFPVGTNRIHMTVGNISNFKLSIDENPDVEEYSVQMVNENEIYVDLVCTQNTTVAFNVERYSDELTTIHKICTKRVKASITVDSQDIYLNSGSYVLTVEGSDISKMNMDIYGDNINVNQLTDGQKSRRYKIDVPVNQTISFDISGSENMTVDKISYENAVLFDEDKE